MEHQDQLQDVILQGVGVELQIQMLVLEELVVVEQHHLVDQPQLQQLLTQVEEEVELEEKLQHLHQDLAVQESL